jgi:hypothetical protein
MLKGIMLEPTTGMRLGAPILAATDTVSGTNLDEGAAGKAAPNLFYGSKSLMTAAPKHAFQAEVQQLLDLMIHSLYSNKDIFLAS